jgi:hypothetical protein
MNTRAKTEDVKSRKYIIWAEIVSIPALAYLQRKHKSFPRKLCAPHFWHDQSPFFQFSGSFSPPLPPAPAPLPPGLLPPGLLPSVPFLFAFAFASPSALEPEPPAPGRRVSENHHSTDVEWTNTRNRAECAHMLLRRSGVLHHEPSPRIVVSI